MDEIKKQVYELLREENSGHGIDHIDRVLRLSLKFAEEENADIYLVSLIALLHDVDDYKLFGDKNAEDLTNAKKFMMNASISQDVQDKVIESIKTIGYSKVLKGIRPTILEAKIVSDADMCDASGICGILRTQQYSLKYGRPFFDCNAFPNQNIDYKEYTTKCADSSVCHIFDKLLKLKGMMLTKSGQKEATIRHQTIINVLKALFKEEDAFEWEEYLNKYLEKEK